MKSIKVKFECGDSIITSINGTKEEILAYYVGQQFNLGDGPNDRMSKAVSVEFLDDDDHTCPTCGHHEAQCSGSGKCQEPPSVNQSYSPFTDPMEYHQNFA